MILADTLFGLKVGNKCSMLLKTRVSMNFSRCSNRSFYFNYASLKVKVLKRAAQVLIGNHAHDVIKLQVGK